MSLHWLDQVTYPLNDASSDYLEAQNKQKDSRLHDQ